MTFLALNIQFDDFVLYFDLALVFQFAKFAHHRASVDADIIGEIGKFHIEFGLSAAVFAIDCRGRQQTFIAEWDQATFICAKSNRFHRQYSFIAE